MEEILTKQIAQKLMEIEGEVRGVSLKSDAEFILKEKDGEGLRKLEERMAKVGCKIKYREIKPMDFLPAGLRPVTLLAIKELFGYDREKFREMGAFQAKISIIIKLFMQYFGSVEILATQAPKMWRKYYTKGDLRVTDIGTEKRYGILRLENFALHPFHCQLLEGYFSNVIKMVVKDPVTCKEVKCIFRGDEYHEFKAEW